MFSILLISQYLGIILTLIGIGISYYSKKSELQSSALLIFSSTLMSQLGYLLAMYANTQEAALMGLKFSFYGKVCIIIFLMDFSLSYCNYEISKWTEIVIVVFLFAMFGFYLTCERHSLYYKTIDFVDEGFFPHVVTTPGIFNIIFDVACMLFMSIILYNCIRKLVIASARREKQRLLCLFLIPVVGIVAEMVNRFKVTGGYDVSALALMIDTVILTVAIHRFELVDNVTQAKDEIVDALSDAILVINRKNELVYKNCQCLNLFPELDLPCKDEVIKRIISCYNRNAEMWVDGRLYLISRKEIVSNDEVQSIVYTFSDNTSDYILTYMDALTNVKNRRALIKSLDNDEFDDKTWFVIMDIDNFKGINDSFGHQVGDESLVCFADTLVNVFSKEAVYRYGGDEFVLIVNSSAEQIESKLDKINAILSSTENDIAFNVSGGYIKYDRGAKLDDLIHSADKALYQSKNLGKGRFTRAKAQ